MSETTQETKLIRLTLLSILETLEPAWDGLGRVERYADLSRRLSAAVSKSPPWGWRYIQGAHAGTIEPSAKLRKAIQVYAASLDGFPVDLGNAVPVQVYAAPGTIKPGALVLASSRPCEYPACQIWFVPKTPNQKYHNRTCGREHRREIDHQKAMDAFYARQMVGPKAGRKEPGWTNAFSSAPK